MNLFFKLLFYISAFIIYWAMIGYQSSLKYIGKIYKSRKLQKDYNHQPKVTVMVVAHNEEKVILEKLHNIIELDYPKEKIEFLISSDNSTDKTNEIVKNFIASHSEYNIRLYEVKARMGKTNAQNEAQKTVVTEYLVMTDANSMMDTNAVKELMAAFTSDDIVYVSGQLSIVNQKASDVSNAEANYWDSDLAAREIEGRIQTITAGNGALYACRTKDYYDFNPIQCHDSAMPPLYALEGKRAIANHDAIAYEKAGEVIEDEFGRKVRMNRIILKHIIPDIRILNVFKYGWFSYFYFGHRTCRYLLWISHLLILVSSALLIRESWIYSVAFLGQTLFYLLALLRAVTKSQNKYLTLIYYYTVTIIAQWVGVYRILTGKSKPFWEKAESTR
ncbi:Glycosyltransferase, catalytic subunit of cellulose synthase and poly-beta-1,6-N-acetylglucosamine synthase [Alkalibacterium putridalgicola]|uniref:Glycosyl transferase n=1 Tax=Alkalibacterium putridalgicola TaxID=426703 RepID=A0A1H7QPV4_9LACT|nr:glycosyltransferase [Alkalibacterium putridalgicola]GEK88392.1 glycosyl transferase [Alkalibacterium putridalgicola]SEL49645.1 Glycosyltransferase, catalytic subunit of cellulose synthase and poly-beta-1,6-N-acetylglucosamine synthase [Alkalibacterium putridalgicola]